MSGPLHSPWVIFAAYLLVVNAATFLMFGWDKRCARLSRERIPERRLLVAAALGGMFGAKAGQRWFRHKTYKQPFRTYLNVIMAGQIGLLCLLVWMVFQASTAGAAPLGGAGSS